MPSGERGNCDQINVWLGTRGPNGSSHRLGLGPSLPPAAVQSLGCFPPLQRELRYLSSHQCAPHATQRQAAWHTLQPGKSLYSVQPRVWLSSGRGDPQKRSHGIAVSLGQPQSSTEDILGCISLKLEIQSAQTTEWPGSSSGRSLWGQHSTGEMAIL